ncbi:hypothetical protein AVEN_132791-1 [Araneus ventricosus]|uniref:Uncharacterized protein n=1 Tax=Araneus ventricosus TaxID=182803 RepID=A0A4Y2RTF6_ARAVE|nr:hypothetical protein AVEN_132791-1 [Araneus ventricosus]
MSRFHLTPSDEEKISSLKTTGSKKRVQEPLLSSRVHDALPIKKKIHPFTKQDPKHESRNLCWVESTDALPMKKKFSLFKTIGFKQSSGTLHGSTRRSSDEENSVSLKTQDPETRVKETLLSRVH